MQPLVIAHRTCPPFAPENSLAGLRVAFEQGADGVEVDLRVSLDLRGLLLHDNSMRRTTGWPLPVEVTPAFWARRLRLEGTAERVPTLAQALDALPPGKLIAIDVKTPWAAFGLVRQLRRRALGARALVWCSSALVARYVLGRGTAAEVAYYKDFEDPESNARFIDRARRLGAHAVSLDWRAIRPALLGRAHAAGLKVYSWHKDYELTPEKLASGLDGLITDYPARAREAIAARTP